MYPYHNRIKQRIKAGELIGYSFVNDYPRIGACMVLEFCTHPQFRPIRLSRLAGYISVMDEWHQSRKRVA